MRKAVIGLVLLSFMGACSGEKKEEASSGAEVSRSAGQESQGRQVIPDDEMTEFEKIMEARLKPYFDSAGSITEKAVSPGERFSVYVFAEFNELYSISAAEFMLAPPQGIEVLSETKSDSTIMTVGSYEKDYMMALRCPPGPTFMLTEYHCRADDSFSGGVIETRKGMTHQFIGFTLCDGAQTMVKARPGQATLTKK